MNKLRFDTVLVVLLSVGGSQFLASCGSGGVSGSPSVATVPDEKSLALAQPGELASFYKAVLRKRFAQGQWSGAMPQVAFALTPTSAGGDNLAPSLISGTNVQETGVDEDDLLKSDGNRIYALTRSIVGGITSNRLSSYVRDSLGQAVLNGFTTLEPGYGLTGMQFSSQSNAIAVISRTYKLLGAEASAPIGSLTIAPSFGYSQTTIELLSAESNLPMRQKMVIDGNFLASRLTGNTLYIATTWAPQLAADYLPDSTTVAQREAAIEALTVADLVPKISINGATPVALLAESDCFLQAKNTSLQIAMTSIIAIKLDSPNFDRNVRCLAGGNEAIYMTPQSIYLATTRWETPTQSGNVTFPEGIYTDIHKLSLTAGALSYKGSGSVAGHLGWNPDAKSYRLSEHDGALRVLSFTGTRGWALPQLVATGSLPTSAASPATLSILKEGPDATGKVSLVTQSTLPNAARPAAIGKPNEQVFAVRFQGPKAYVVTFRQTDPLYVLDLSSITDPKIAGELNITGFSDTLLPLPNNLMFGIGKSADENGIVGGVKVALFDVSNPAAPTEVASRIFGDRFSATGQDYSNHGVNLLSINGVTRIALPMRLSKLGSQSNPTANSQGLYRFEINHSAKTLMERSVLGNVDFSTFGATELVNSLWATYDLSMERSIQIDNSIYYLSGGRLASYSW